MSFRSSESSERRREAFLESVDMALENCESDRDQFKLIETPMNSFVLITNVLPEDGRPWVADLSGLVDMGDLNVFPENEKEDWLGRVDEYQDCLQSDAVCGAVNGSRYLVYEELAWTRAISLDKDDALTEAMELMINPQNWKSGILVDPLPCFWMVFYGKNSFCESSDCLYRFRFGVPGPILFPPHMYTPNDDMPSFILSMCNYFKYLYLGRDFLKDDYPGVPFDLARVRTCLVGADQLKSEHTYLSKLCLLCHLYRQNKDINCSSGTFVDCIILGGCGSEFLGDRFNSGRDLTSGDAILAPQYNLESLLQRIETNGRFC